MKKLLIIVFVVISAVAAAATLNKANPEVKTTPVATETVEVPNSNALATWD
ncbi:hypothetical protein [Pedobacter alpinus]|uniref:Uncharacterized protein n=1 Tax=Pedobacter alpinus TaxID=1590643 RepID=A0ABW5TXF7_9SPHI